MPLEYLESLVVGQVYRARLDDLSRKVLKKDNLPDPFLRIFTDNYGEDGFSPYFGYLPLIKPKDLDSNSHIVPEEVDPSNNLREKWIRNFSENKETVINARIIQHINWEPKGPYRVMLTEQPVGSRVKSSTDIEKYHIDIEHALSVIKGGPKIFYATYSYTAPEGNLAIEVVEEINLRRFVKTGFLNPPQEPQGSIYADQYEMHKLGKEIIESLKPEDCLLVRLTGKSMSGTMFFEPVINLTWSDMAKTPEGEDLTTRVMGDDKLLGYTSPEYLKPGTIICDLPVVFSGGESNSEEQNNAGEEEPNGNSEEEPNEGIGFIRRPNTEFGGFYKQVDVSGAADDIGKLVREARITGTDSDKVLAEKLG